MKTFEILPQNMGGYGPSCYCGGWGCECCAPNGSIKIIRGTRSREVRFKQRTIARLIARGYNTPRSNG